MNNEQQLALQFVKAGHNLYIGGAAGTGKSFLVKETVAWARSEGKQVALTCTTGVACCIYPQALKAMTIHKWCGIGDGRFTAQQIIAHMDACDDRYIEPMDRMKQVEILIIDEVSMFSCLIFEKLERIMRHVKQNNRAFGGVQVILVGDFLQLPPVRNIRYSDPGEFCFESEAFPVHRIFLHEVMRQRDQQFIHFVNNLAKGETTEQTLKYVKELSRPLLATGDTTRLFSVNILADMYNRDCLMRLPGQVYEFEALDEGEEHPLNTLTIQKTLWLKKNAKVMLLRNLSDHLVNGLCGTVIAIREGEVDVRFDTLDKVTTLTRMNFAVYDSAMKRNLAVRNQIPLKLCYAITIHKAQGMTLNRVEVDCRQIFQPGQLAVAMGRVKSPDDLRVVNFTKDAVISQPAVVLDFLEGQWTPANPDISCCSNRFPRDLSHDTPTPTSTQFEETATSQSEFQSEENQTEPFSDFDDEFLANIDLESFTSVTEPEKVPESTVPADLLLNEEITNLKFEDPQREGQIIFNQWIDYLLQNTEKFKAFCNIQYSYLSHTFEKTVKDKQSQKTQTAFYTEFQRHLTSDAYKAELLNLLPESDRVDIVFNLGYDIMSILRMYITKKAAEGLPQRDLSHISSQRQVSSEMTDTAKGKVRYIGGYVVAKLCYRTNVTIQRCAYKTDKKHVEQYESAKRRLRFLHFLTCCETSTTIYPESMLETARKQNINRGLTNITDEAYKFFEALISSVLSHQSGENLNKYGGELYKYVTAAVNGDTRLHERFLHVICKASAMEEVSFDTIDIPDIDSEITACVHGLTYSADVLDDIFRDFVSLASSVLYKQFTTDVITSMKITKKMEHRKQVHVSSKKKFKEQEPSPSTSSDPTTSSKKARNVKKALPSPSTSSENVSASKKAKQTSSGEPVPSTSSAKVSSSKKSKKTLQQEPSDSSDEENAYCPKCNKLYTEGEDWICCDSCNNWIDRKCAGLSNALRWKKYLRKGVNFFCPDCQ